MAFRPDEEDPKPSYRLENTERVEDDAQAGEGNAISPEAAVVFRQDDITGETKQKIGQYLECEIKDESKQSEARIRNKPPGLPNLQDVDPDTQSTPAEGSFTEELSQTEQTQFDSYSNSGLFPFRVSVRRSDTPSDDNDEPSAQVSRTRLGMYSNLEENISDNTQEEAILSQTVEQLLDENARFSPREDGTPYVTPDRPSEGDAGTGEHIFQTRLGTHSPRKFPNKVEADPAVQIGKLKDLGLRMLLKSSGEAFIPEDGSVGQVTAARLSSTAVPGVARLGFRQPFNRFSPTETLAPVTDASKATVDIDLSGDAVPSFGNVNNPLVPFAAISSSTSSVIVGTLLVLTISAILSALAELFDADIPTNFGIGGLPGEEELSIEDAIRQRLGSFKGKVEEDGGAGFGEALLGFSGFKDLLIDTDNDYGDAVQRGTQIFFGLEPGGIAGNIGANIGAAATSIVESPGFWNTILRSIVGSFTDPLLTVVNGIAGAVGGDIDVAGFSITNYDVDQLTGPASDPFALLEIINVIKESKLLKIMNLIAAIGDVALNTENGDFISEIDSVPDTTTIKSDKTPGVTDERINPAALVKKNRLSERVNKAKPGAAGALAWGASTLPSLYLLNTNRQLAEKLYTGETKNFDEVFSETRKDTIKKSGDNNRLTKEEVRAIEEELDSYYVPFYFQDLRTNEIIALHAFIENMSDSFNVELNESHGYGRIGNVYSYKNTVRSISISFKIVATNKEDFDQMWYKINKITMFCFPQYTLGRPMAFDDAEGNTFKFIQPFSQLPSSSPMIRLRIGDVFKTNYSDIDLARIHGLGQKNFSTPASEDFSLTEATQEAIDAKVNEIATRHRDFNFLPSETFFFNQAVEVVGSRQPTPGSQAGMRVTKSPAGAGGLGSPPVPTPDIPGVGGGPEDGPPNVTIPAGTKATVVGVFVNRKKYTVELDPMPDGLSNRLEVDFSRALQSSVIDLDYTKIHEFAVLQADPAAALFQSQTDEVVGEVRSFFSPNAESGDTTNVNPVFKSFESTRGEGIPGFVKSLNLDWNDAIWETEILNSRAPKWATIQMEFAPIYDLNPGIDVDGNMIGAIYNVGEIMRRLKLNRETALSNETRRMNFHTRKARTNNT